jgi:uncharacterized membrane protein
MEQRGGSSGIITRRRLGENGLFLPATSFNLSILIKTHCMKAFIPSKLAEVLFALIIAYFGYWHFTHAVAMGRGVPGFIPGPGSFWIYLTGAGFILAAIAILTDIKKVLACYLLAAMLVLFAFVIHFRSFESNPFNALKDLAIAMCAIIVGNNKK